LIAAVQAELPSSKRRLYSRPLIALLFLLQPIERGLARYGSQLRFRPSPGLRLANGPGGQPLSSDPEVLSYWSDGATDRYAFLGTLLARLEQDSWQVRADTGWSDYDLEVLEARWARLRLMTASEYLEKGRIMLRCRLETKWSPAAKVLFCGLFAAEMLLASLIGPTQPWVWMILLTLPVIGWILEFQQSKLRRAVAVLLDEVACQRKWVKIGAEQNQGNPSTVESRSILSIERAAAS
jgi:hypothetical protein